MSGFAITTSRPAADQRAAQARAAIPREPGARKSVKVSIPPSSGNPVIAPNEADDAVIDMRGHRETPAASDTEGAGDRGHRHVLAGPRWYFSSLE
jgi:hypothetical protein